MNKNIVNSVLIFAVVLIGSSPIAAQTKGGKGQNRGEKIFREWDKNEDGFLIKTEVPSGPRKIFDRMDTNGDGKISLAEHLRKGNKPTRPNKPTQVPNTDNSAFSISQTWEQEPDGYNRPVYVIEPESIAEQAPVVLFFHGNGGDASRQIKRWADTFPEYLVVAPQGYLKSWNVSGESSTAPDVEFFREIISELKERYDYADMTTVSLIGSSNGAAYIYRLMIEVEDDLFKKAVPMVSSLLEQQYHSESFWKPSGDTANYDIKADPVGGREILYLHGTDDKVVPFEGGLRGRKFKHLSANRTAYIWAREQGYQGSEPSPSDGKDLGNGLIVHKFEGSNVTFVAVEGGGHGLQPHRDAATEYVRQFLTR